MSWHVTFGHRLDICVVAKININRGILIFKYHVSFELFYDEDSMEGKKWHRGLNTWAPERGN